MFTTVRYRLLLVLLCGLVCAPPSWSAPVTLQNATTTYSQGSGGPFYVSYAIDGNSSTGWAVLSNPAIAAFQTQADVGHAGGTELTFVLDHQAFNLHNLGRFRLSVTTDHRDTFCDGKQAVNGVDPGDVTANWTVLLPTAMAATNVTTFLTRIEDDVILVTGNNPPKDTYTITALTNVTGITGVRLEVLKDPSHPETVGPGRSPENFVLTDFSLNEAPYTGPPQWNVNADGNWSDAANWVGGVPNAAGATADFRTAITAPRAVTVDSPATVGTMHFQNASAYTIGGSSALALEGSAGTAAINVAAGSHAIHAPLVLNDPTNVQVSAGNTLGILGGIGGAGGVTKEGDGTLVVGQASYNGATVIEQGTLRLSNSVVPGSTVWFDTTDAGTLTVDGNNNVTEWRSRAGANNLTGVSPSTITYHTSGAGPNDLAYVNAAGSSYFDFDTDIPDARTLFMVFKPTATPNAYTPFFGINSGGAGGNYMGVGGVGYVENTYSAPGLRTTGATPAQWFLDGTVFNPVTEPLSLTDYRVISVAAGANVRVENIGRDRTFAHRSLAADIGEILIYSNVLSEADRKGRRSVPNQQVARGGATRLRQREFTRLDRPADR